MVDAQSMILTSEEWLSVLLLSDMWCLKSFRNLAIRKLTELGSLSPTEQIMLGKKYNITDWVVSGCVSFIDRDLGPQVDEVNTLGMPESVLIYKMREMQIRRARYEFRSYENIKRDIYNIFLGLTPPTK